jgi:hypothetical protein
MLLIHATRTDARMRSTSTFGRLLSLEKIARRGQHLGRGRARFRRVLVHITA